MGLNLILLLVLACICIMVYIVRQLWLMDNNIKYRNNQLSVTLKKELGVATSKNKTYFNEFIQQMRTMDNIEKQNINVTSDKFEDNDDMFSPSSKKHNNLIELSGDEDDMSNKTSDNKEDEKVQQKNSEFSEVAEIPEVAKIPDVEVEVDVDLVVDVPEVLENQTVDTTDTKNRVILKSISRYTKAELEDIAKNNNIDLPENATKPVIFETLKNFFI